MKKYTPYLLGLIVFTTQGSSLFAAKNAMRPFGDDTVHYLASRFLITIILFCVLITFRIIKVNYKRKNLKWVMLLSIINTAYFIVEGIGLKTAPASQASICLATVPLMTAVLAVLILKQRLRRVEICGIIGSVFGVILVNFAPGSSLAINFGVIMIWAAALIYAFYNIVAVKLNSEFTGFEVAFFANSITGSFYIILSLSQHAKAGTLSTWLSWTKDLESVAYLVFLSAIISIVCFSLYIIIVGMLPITIVSGMSAWGTLVGILLGAFVLKESISPISAFGIFLIIGSVLFLALSNVGARQPIPEANIESLQIDTESHVDETHLV